MPPAKSKTFLIAGLAFVAGVAAASFMPAPEKCPPLVIFTAAVGSGLAASLTGRKSRAWIIALTAFFFFFGAWRYLFALPPAGPGQIGYYTGAQAGMTAVITGEPDIRESGQRFPAAVKELNGQGGISGRLLVITGAFPAFAYGETIKLRGRLEAPEPINDFAYDRYLARSGIYAVAFYPAIEKTGQYEGALFYRLLYRVRDRLRQAITAGLAEPAAGLGRALAIGDKRGIDEKLRADFARAGLSHIIAISGLHVSIMAAIVSKLLISLGFSRRFAFYLAAGGLGAYVLLVGAPPSAVRAGLMGFLVLWAMHLGRLSRGLNSLLAAAAALLLINPRLLRDDLGFELSFLAVFGIMAFYPPLRNLAACIKWPRFRSGGEIIAVTVAAQVFTWPVIAASFGTVSLAAPLSNLLVLWLLPVLLVALIAAAVAAVFFPALGPAVFFPAALGLEYIIAVAGRTSGFGLSAIEVGYLPFALAAAYYAFFAFLARRTLKPRPLVDEPAPAW